MKVKGYRREDPSNPKSPLVKIPDEELAALQQEGKAIPVVEVTGNEWR